MPLIQKLIRVGDSYAVTIPKTWLTYYERKSGQRIREVAVEINDKLTIQPILQDRFNESKSHGKDVNNETLYSS